MDAHVQRVNGKKSQNCAFGRIVDRGVRGSGPQHTRVPGAPESRNRWLCRVGGLAQIDAFEFGSTL